MRPVRWSLRPASKSGPVFRRANLVFLAALGLAAVWAVVVSRSLLLRPAELEAAVDPDPPQGVPPRTLENDALIQYWRRGPRLPSDWVPLEPQTPEERFVTFEDDAGGWNNIRMAFEAYCLVAQLLNRTLVLSPKARFYLLDMGPIKTFKRAKTYSEYGQYFDLDAMRASGLRIITTEEFIDRNVMPDIPVDALQSLQTIENNGVHTKWFLHLRERPDVKIWPSGPVSIPKAITYLPPYPGMAYSATSQPAKAIHFPVHLSKSLRYLDGAPALVSHAQRHVQQYAKRFVRNHLVYSPHIIESTRKAVFESNVLKGALSYTCFHIRRNELQYKHSFLGARESLKNARNLLKRNETVYIATDETSPGFFRAFEDEGHRVIRLQDVRSSFSAEPKFEGMIEQTICSLARVFIGTTTSTFSSYIHRLRMHTWSDQTLADVDLRCWFHDTGVIERDRIDSTNPHARPTCPGAAGFSKNDALFFEQKTIMDDR